MTRGYQQKHHFLVNLLLCSLSARNKRLSPPCKYSVYAAVFVKIQNLAYLVQYHKEGENLLLGLYVLLYRLGKRMRLKRLSKNKN